MATPDNIIWREKIEAVSGLATVGESALPGVLRATVFTRPLVVIDVAARVVVPVKRTR